MGIINWLGRGLVEEVDVEQRSLENPVLVREPSVAGPGADEMGAVLYCKGSEGSPNLPYDGNNNFTGFFPKPRVLFIVKVVPPAVIWVPVNRGRTVDSIQGRNLPLQAGNLFLQSGNTVCDWDSFIEISGAACVFFRVGGCGATVDSNNKSKPVNSMSKRVYVVQRIGGITVGGEEGTATSNERRKRACPVDQSGEYTAKFRA
ncbi:hypothetical protein ILYODFUR_009212 [Ilyodon furcidens]|uniref:Uncharacterized protein n=1 Tax=Ilyodon furcidens TaxID=33524 RepID=A0ABV0URH1_9TELE